MIKLKDLYNKADYQDEFGVLFNGDCLDIIKDIPDDSINLLLTDPPYGIDFQSKWRKDKNNWTPKIANDKTPFIDFIEPILPKVKIIGGGDTYSQSGLYNKFLLMN